VGSNNTTYAWDFENRLTSIALPGSGGTVSFKYDPFGRRIYKSSSSGTSIYAYDDDNLIEETNASGTVDAPMPKPKVWMTRLPCSGLRPLATMNRTKKNGGGGGSRTPVRKALRHGAYMLISVPFVSPSALRTSKKRSWLVRWFSPKPYGPKGSGQLTV
jgi:hypothetical protein